MIHKYVKHTDMSVLAAYQEKEEESNEELSCLMRSLKDCETTLTQLPGAIFGSCNDLKTRHSFFHVFEGKRAGID